MLFLHREAVPEAKGGAPTFYRELVGTWLAQKDRYAYELKVCSGILTFYESTRLEASLRNIRNAFQNDDPPLVVEAHRTFQGSILFQLTSAGEVPARQLVDSLSEGCRTTMRNAIFERHPHRRCQR